MIESTRVIVGVNGSLSSLAAVHRAVEEAARRNAVLVPVVAWSATEGERLRPLSELEHAARRLMDTVFEQAFGGYPDGVVIRPIVVRAEPGPALVAVADRPTDLLVLGTGRRSRLQHVIHGSVTRYCRAHAVCEILAVSPSELLQSLELSARSGAPMPRLSGRAATWGRPADATAH
ncbi:universal stress protein [Kitasatospora sp. GP82]|uniref:universal stress protein n=1 Tax=Kitasatospora sp. GP82 TaxID=3035089 RepID=UPI002476AFAE|nr:universal stress protein [Kitasatospora sp. GP82]MDH6128788.1 nucleotide-binding universal stress UspA family protein [Kitasatospora sp. GP82]